jgi:hypothetical protein
MPTRVTITDERILHVDGKPSFLIGARHMPVGGTPELLHEAGFNACRFAVFGSESSESEEIPPLPEGMRFWAYLYDRADFTKSPEYEGQLREAIAILRDHPNLLCYESYNEPTMLYHSDRQKTQPEDLARGTACLRELDSNHPIWLAHSCMNTVETLKSFNNCLDIVGCNPYPVIASGTRAHIGVRTDGKMVDCIDQSIHAVGKYTDKMNAVAASGPVWMLIQAMANEHWFNPTHNPEFSGQSVDESKVIYPTFDQMRFMAYDAIVSGATGLAFAMHKTPASGAIWADTKQLVAELSLLQNALCSPQVTGRVEVSYTDLGFTIWDGVRILARCCHDGVYLFAANTAFDPAHVSIRLPVNVGSVADVIGEDRTIGVVQNTIEDQFEPYGVHVYRLL